MKNVTNKLMYSAGTLLLMALVIHVFQMNNQVKDIVLLAATFLSGYPIAKKSIQAVRMKVFSIELLISIAVIGALIIGEYVESAVVTFLYLFGAYLEARTLEKARISLRTLTETVPLEATVLRNGKKITLKAEEVLVNDHVVVRSGGKIAVDGTILSGQALINEAAITGESVPVSKTKGDPVFSGSIIDNGYLEINAQKVGEDTTFAKIIELVEEAQETKAKTQKFLEKFAYYYTPGILILSVVVFLFTFDFHLAITFLVIACPGALVISAPVSIVAGLGNAAKNGILIKGGDKVEILAKIKGIVFDKTGTLTQGKPSITAIRAFGRDENELLLLAAQVETASEHHLGRTIVEEAERRDLRLIQKPTDIEVLKGYGIRALVNGKTFFVGNQKALFKGGIKINKEIETYAYEQERLGNTAVYVVIDQQVAGIISIADQIRKEAKESVRQLKQNGIKHTVMLTGDNQHTAKMVAEQLNIDQYYAELLPTEKVDRVNACKHKGLKLAMVGDGINDAPAIATADIGIAMGGTGTHIAMETADVVLMSDRLDK